jgi:hypothetical protein
VNPEHTQAVLSYGRSPPRWQRSLLKWAAIIVLAAGALYLALLLLDRALQPRVYTNITRAQASMIPGLPADAARINCRIGGQMDACPLTYEFDTSLQSFHEWAEANGWEIHEREGEIMPFNFSTVQLPSALFCSRMTGPDSGEHAAYDLNTGRAYYYSHTR